MQLPHRNHASHFEKAKTAFEEGAGNDELEVEDPPRDKLSTDNEKESIEHVSHA
jgi:SHS family lactate transporter-like MFS transporter